MYLLITACGKGLKSKSKINSTVHKQDAFPVYEISKTVHHHHHYRIVIIMTSAAATAPDCYMLQPLLRVSPCAAAAVPTTLPLLMTIMRLSVDVAGASLDSLLSQRELR
eukprot:15422-Heterococcus_DN1.PRE.2